ncbi:hypothetical protein RHSIM_Rhsim13G0105700 [Rhododendron simsii]|uniref:Uncharacterized protein n=1 Tax=Rhododendron simsii TaxID=118357 RepID=A0A834G586_RHOSS|nr:hypothetical protein RHSIM_Rhsim13G0105700 [Rhododendron simsii]
METSPPPPPWAPPSSRRVTLLGVSGFRPNRIVASCRVVVIKLGMLLVAPINSSTWLLVLSNGLVVATVGGGYGVTAGLRPVLGGGDSPIVVDRFRVF